MIRFRLKELIADREFQRGAGKVTLDAVSKATGIHRTTLSKIARQRGYNTTTQNLDALCAFFNCPIEKLVEYVPSDEGDTKGRK